MLPPLKPCLEAAKEMRRSSPQTQIVALTDSDEASCILDAIKAGIRGCVLSSQTVEELVEAIQDVAAGGTYLSSQAWSAMVEAYISTSDPNAHSRSPRPH
jgi:two-component system response regulator NreC